MHKHNRKNSGQVLIIVALIVTLLFLSTSLYVAESLKSEVVYQSGSSQTLSFYEQGLRHTIISALANVSNGGDTEVLLEDLDRFGTVATDHSYNSMLTITNTLLNTTPYQNGIWIDWGSDGAGVTSACINYCIDSSETSSTSHVERSINVTTDITINGNYTRGAGTTKYVNLTCTISNDGLPSLAKDFSVYFEKDGSLVTEAWTQVSSVTLTDFGNSTYSMSFTISTTNWWNPALISVKCNDLRGIFVQANMTCTLVS